MISELLIKDTENNGKGAFAKKVYAKGDHILFFKGYVVSEKELMATVDKGGYCSDDELQIDEDLHMITREDDESFFINHSCCPNSGVRSKSELCAINDIKEGEEITFDYSTTVGKSVEWFMNQECKCGSLDCRKEIGNVSTVPITQLEKYRDAGVLQDFIRKQLWD